MIGISYQSHTIHTQTQKNKIDWSGKISKCPDQNEKKIVHKNFLKKFLRISIEDIHYNLLKLGAIQSNCVSIFMYHLPATHPRFCVDCSIKWVYFSIL